MIYNIDGYWTSSDLPIDQAQQEHNARGLFTLLYRIGFTAGPICAMLGNIQAESGLNPGNLQGASSDPLPDNNTMLSFTSGAGIVQWTPAGTTLVPYAISISRNWYSMVTQFLRLQYEYDNDFEFIGVTVNGQYYNWDIFHDYEPDPLDPMQTINDLAEAFLRGYLRPADPDATLRNRQYYSRVWYSLLKDFRPLPVWLYNKGNKNRKELKRRWIRA